MMERTHGFMRRDFGGIGTDGGEYNRRERRYILRSENASYWSGASTSIDNRFTIVKTEPYLLRQRTELQNTTNHVKSITNGLQKSKIQHQMRVIMSLERKVEYFEEKIDFMKNEIIYINERSRHELQEKDEYISDLSDQLQQTENISHDTEAARDEIVMPQNIKIKFQEREIEKRDLEITSLRELLNCEKTENEDYVKLGLQENYSQLSVDKEQMQQRLKKWQDKETEFKKDITLLQNELESRDQNIRKLEKMLESKNIEINDCKEHLQSIVKKKDDQLHQTLAKLQETEAKTDQTLSSLEEKNQYLQEEVQNGNREVERLKEMLANKMIAIHESDERQVNIVMKKKDDQISDLNDRPKQTLKTMNERERV